MAKKKKSGRGSKALASLEKALSGMTMSGFREVHPRAKAVKGHAGKGRKVCVHCGGTHTTQQHRSHGKGAFKRSGH